MSSAAVEHQRRFDVRSADGTRIAVWADGSGPPIVLVHGSPSEHTTFDPLVAELRHDLSTFALDRRGSGSSGDSEEFAIEREFEDVAAVVEAVATRTGGPVALWGHSYGANVAMGAAALATAVVRLILYEPSFGLAYPPGSIEAIDAALRTGDRRGAVRAALVDTGAMTAEDFDGFTAGPRWPRVLASAPALARECRVEQDWVYRPGQFAGIAAPTLLLAGSDTDPALAELTRRAAVAIPGARIEVLPGHAHFAFKTDPAAVAAVVRRFLRS